MYSRKYFIYILELAATFLLFAPKQNLADDVFVQTTHPPSFDSQPVYLRRFADGNGFHRTMMTDFVFQAGGSHNYTADNCRVTFVEEIPSGMYVDLYQIAAQEAWGGPKVFFPEIMDIEKPEYMSQEHTIYVFGEVHTTEDSLRTTVSFPIHLRYHRPSSLLSHATVKLPTPQVLVRCIENEVFAHMGRYISAPCDAKNSSTCTWIDVHLKQDLEPLEFLVPIGQREHAGIVVAVTLIVTTGGMLLLVYGFLKKGQLFSGHRFQASNKQAEEPKSMKRVNKNKAKHE